MIAEGRRAPDFTLENQDGQKVRLSDLRGRPVVLYFYPRDNTPGCTTEACAFRDAREDYAAAGAHVIGVSPDTVAAHRKFADKFKLPFTLLADPEKKACTAYGVWKEKKLYGKTSMGVERTTVVIDASGTIRKMFPKVKVAGHSDQVLEAIKSLENA
jgi:peroxiredoxin Q/BCP